MVTARKSRSDVVAAAGKLFAEKGYHGTSMRDLGRNLGLLGSSLYAHVDSKEDLLVEVVSNGADMFQASADAALAIEGNAAARLRGLIEGHVDVVLENLDVARTFLNEARVLDDAHREHVVAARDAYEAAFRTVISQGASDGSFRSDVDPKVASIFVLSILNAIERWFRPSGTIDRSHLVAGIYRFSLSGLS
jgi:AcrR family transcriptional regulator